MKTVIFDSEELLDRATAQVKALLDEKPDAVLALSAGEDCLRLLERLAAMQQAGELRFSRAKFFAVTDKGEYVLRFRLYEPEDRMDRRCFVRISNSEIINLKKVKSFDLSFRGTICVEFKDCSVTYVSRRYVSKIKQVLGI